MSDQEQVPAVLETSGLPAVIPQAGQKGADSAHQPQDPESRVIGEDEVVYLDDKSVALTPQLPAVQKRIARESHVAHVAFKPSFKRLNATQGQVNSDSENGPVLGMQLDNNGEYVLSRESDAPAIGPHQTVYVGRARGARVSGPLVVRVNQPVIVTVAGASASKGTEQRSSDQPLPAQDALNDNTGEAHQETAEDHYKKSMFYGIFGLPSDAEIKAQKKAKTDTPEEFSLEAMALLNGMFNGFGISSELKEALEAAALKEQMKLEDWLEAKSKRKGQDYIEGIQENYRIFKESSELFKNFTVFSYNDGAITLFDREKNAYDYDGYSVKVRMADNQAFGPENAYLAVIPFTDGIYDGTPKTTDIVVTTHGNTRQGEIRAMLMIAALVRCDAGDIKPTLYTRDNEESLPGKIDYLTRSMFDATGVAAMGISEEKLGYLIDKYNSQHGHNVAQEAVYEATTTASVSGLEPFAHVKESIVLNGLNLGGVSPKGQRNSAVGSSDDEQPKGSFLKRKPKVDKFAEHQAQRDSFPPSLSM